MDTLGGASRLDDAATYYAARRLRLVQRTVPEVVEELLVSRAHKSIRHVKDLRGRLGRFNREVTGYIANVTQRDLGLWLRGLGLSSRSHDNFRQVLVLLFRFAQKQGYLPEKAAVQLGELPLDFVMLNQVPPEMSDFLRHDSETGFYWLARKTPADLKRRYLDWQEAYKIRMMEYARVSISRAKEMTEQLK